MLEESCIDFVYELASKAPVPGGGGASAYVGAIGMSLGSMVGNLTLGKIKYADVETDIIELLEKSRKLIDDLLKLVQKDADVFYPLSQAYGLPQTTEDEKALKDNVLQPALIEAARIPLEIAEICLQAIELHEEFAKKGSRIAISDVGTGVVFCKAALQGAKLNVLINTKIMKDQEIKSNIESRLNEIVEIGTDKADQVYLYVEELLKTKP